MSHNWLQWPSDHRRSLSVPEGLTDFDNVARTHPYTYRRPRRGHRARSPPCRTPRELRTLRHSPTMILNGS